VSSKETEKSLDMVASGGDPLWVIILHIALIISFLLIIWRYGSSIEKYTDDPNNPETFKVLLIVFMLLGGVGTAVSLFYAAIILFYLSVFFLFSCISGFCSFIFSDQYRLLFMGCIAFLSGIILAYFYSKISYKSLNIKK